MDWSFFLQFVWLTSLEIESEDARQFLRVRIWIWRMQDAIHSKFAIKNDKEVKLAKRVFLRIINFCIFSILV